MSTTKDPILSDQIEDLSSINGGVTHAGCNNCYPLKTLHLGDPYIAICGAQAYVQETEPGANPGTVPEDACPRCLEAARHPFICPECGQ